ncbi:MAG: [FeFe] hydrogenase H-cluster radical SAM maturase HydE [Chitinophagales bacterium]
MDLKYIIDYYHNNEVLEREHLIELLMDDSPETLKALRAEADRVRHLWVGDEVHVRGIIEFSNNCIRSCSYCGINRLNPNTNRYRIPPELIVETAYLVAAMGLKTLVLQSGDDFYYTGEILADVTREIKKTGMALTLAVGERSIQDLWLWREAGADRYLLKFETSNSELYARLHPGTDLQKRMSCLQRLRSLGYQVGSGFIVGLPGQTAETLADDIILLRSLHVEMAGTGPFIPHPGTVLAGYKTGSVDLALKVLALTRLMLPWAHLPATTALASLHPDGRKLGLTGGANVLMPNMTPLEYRRFYEIYPHKAEVIDPSEKLYEDTRTLIKDLGRKAAIDCGHGLPQKND